MKTVQEFHAGLQLTRHLSRQQLNPFRTIQLPAHLIEHLSDFPRAGLQLSFQDGQYRFRSTDGQIRTLVTHLALLLAYQPQLLDQAHTPVGLDRIVDALLPS